ncbi:DUF4105 domain-containing protein [Agriterribacter sp.]|uniref:Lnb N-terminal periplasmic domain-containing protein n=1 Tax=Agriterribacter sp. TaxID=2821509 RepID=UPI002B785B77|nr:DUF4105 domain-containing protein [Agriterribacter sp.]HRO45479.1 DUF4105 domain-containing protein [Agriterribacter sp.]HRQ19399.1 DUF4105 domain-containing protein [Agriterribacter sp.]
MKKILPFFFIAFFAFATAYSQTDSSHLRITLLTCSPGEELYSTFGHSALRVTDSATFTDKVYNYGTFDFNPDFYPKFIRGKLLYYLSVETYPDFIYSYQLEQRSIIEQELNLSGEEKIKLNAALQLNASGSNKFYKYDFLFDNCATRIRDIVKNNTTEAVTIKNILPYPDVSFRELIHNSLNRSGMYWSKLGIDILLGRGLDKPAQNEQTMFLPDYLFKGFDSAAIGNKPLVRERHSVYTAPSATASPKSFFTPFIAFAAALMVFIALTVIRRQWSKKALESLDFLLFLCAGLLGILLVGMWLGTDHVLCRNNYNLLWALPFHAIAAFFLKSKRKLMHQYWALSVLVYALVLAFWVMLPQELNKDLVPLIVLLGWRSWKQFKRSENAQKVAHI